MGSSASRDSMILAIARACVCSIMKLFEEDKYMPLWQDMKRVDFNNYETLISPRNNSNIRKFAKENSNKGFAIRLIRKIQALFFSVGNLRCGMGQCGKGGKEWVRAGKSDIFF